MFDKVAVSQIEFMFAGGRLGLLQGSMVTHNDDPCVTMRGETPVKSVIFESGFSLRFLLLNSVPDSYRLALISREITWKLEDSLAKLYIY